ncbi:MAG: hypothetical protein LBJ95_03325 [Oscillospiraceae bacterium]|nr:hypothetical protein [Oscillospiraceae bacterium]
MFRVGRVGCMRGRLVSTLTEPEERVVCPKGAVTLVSDCMDRDAIRFRRCYCYD